MNPPLVDAPQPSRKVPWVRGLGTRPARPRKSWEEQLSFVLLGRFADVDGDGTHATEDALGLNASAYWFAGRACEAYGKGITLWEAVFLPEHAPSGGLCPFDSGGLASRIIRGDPEFVDDDDRRAFFDASDRGLAEWYAILMSDIAVRWPTIAAYVTGERPAVADRVSKPPENESRAWAWEARVEKMHATEAAVSLRRLVITYDDRQALRAWISVSSTRWTSAEAAELGEQLRNALVVDDPVSEATAYLLAEFEQ